MVTIAVLPTFRTWSTGEIVTAAELNSNIRDAGNFFLAVPVCELRQAVAQSIPNNSFTPVTFDTEEINNDSMHSTVTNPSRVTPKTQGRYQLAGSGSIVANATGRRIVSWNVNASELSGARTEAPYAPLGTADWVMPTRTRTWFFNGSTDYAELTVFQTTGAAINTAISAVWEQPTTSVRWIATT